jgi:N-acetylmuramoyl-L-alanine amidase
MTTWRNQYVHVNQYTRPGKKLNGVRKLIVHYTANPGATAANHFGYFDKTAPAAKRYASAHIFVDKTEAICIIPLDEVAYAAGDVQQRDKNGVPYRGVPELLPSANYLSISVELCIEKDGTFHADTIARAVDVFAELCAAHKLDPKADIVRHYDVTHKNCPAPWVADVSKFVEFKCQVAEKMAPTVVTPTPVATPISTTPVIPKAIPVVAKAATAQPSVSLLRQGDTGAAVKEMQTKLNKAGFNCGAADGIFGAKTTDALRKFQASRNLTVDGVYGPATKAKLEAVFVYTLPGGVIREGDKGTAVKQLQTALNAAGFGCGTADGAFGPKTEASVKKLQAKYGLASDGIYGPKTKVKLAEVLNYGTI